MIEIKNDLKFGSIEASFENLHMNCFKDQSNKDLPFTFPADSLMSVDKCIAKCRNQGFKYAGLQNGFSF